MSEIPEFKLLSSPLVHPFLQISSYKQVEIPFKYIITSKSQIINDFIHLNHPKLPSHLLINKKSLISTTQTSPIQQLISPRKSYEISQFIQYINHLYTLNQFEFIIDVGAGKSYLGRSLLLSQNFKIISIETNTFKNKTSKRLANLIGTSGFQTLEEKIHYATSLNFGEDTLHFINSSKKINGDVPKALIIGLDTCGDLPDLIMGGVVKGLKGLNVIGCCFVSCCFHKVTHFSSFFLKNVQVKFNVLANTQDLNFLNKDEIVLSFQKELYVQRFIDKIDDVYDLNVLKNGDFKNWDIFITRIDEIYRLGEQKMKTLKDYEISDDEFMEFFTKWCYIKGFLSHVVETVVHQDRVQYLKEHGYNSALIDVIFDFTKSSRNIIVSSF